MIEYISVTFHPDCTDGNVLLAEVIIGGLLGSGFEPHSCRNILLVYPLKSQEIWRPDGGAPLQSGEQNPRILRI